jgi:phospho-N-acetylmuramoyl-pentapeptide-transferase
MGSRRTTGAICGTTIVLYYLHGLTDLFSPLRIFQYVTVRSFGAAGTAFLLSLLLGPCMIGRLRRLKFGQPVRKDYVEDLHEAFHGKKQGTPTMGGVLIIASVALSTLLWAIPTNGYVLLAVGTMLYMGGIGLTDDYLKIRQRGSKGLSARGKLLLQSVWVSVLLLFLLSWEPAAVHAEQLMLPFMKQPVVSDLGVVATFIFFYLVMVGATNAVNLTDGLDGLAVGCTGSVALAYLVMAYAAGHAVFADYLQVPFIRFSSELAVFCGSLLGGCLGFLWYNCYPARVFMGDTGSLALGGAIAAVAIAIKQELVLIIVGGVFVIEALSVVLQVASFKLTGRRIFRCAPLHHHFERLEKEAAELEGRPVAVIETKITVRFWILSIIFALIGVATLKLR